MHALALERNHETVIQSDVAKENRKAVDGHEAKEFFRNILISKSTRICDASFFNMISTVRQPIGIVINDNPTVNLVLEQAWCLRDGA
jgi:hypothetical protein